VFRCIDVDSKYQVHFMGCILLFGFVTNLHTIVMILSCKKKMGRHRFLDGLSPRIKERIAFPNITSYTKMVHIATFAKKGIREADAD
jgi:hypothetical protein